MTIKVQFFPDQTIYRVEVLDGATVKQVLRKARVAQRKVRQARMDYAKVACKYISCDSVNGLY